MRIHNIVAANAAANQNLFFGDDVHLMIQERDRAQRRLLFFTPGVDETFLLPGSDTRSPSIARRPASGA